MKLIIAVSGCSGGTSGPQSLYHSLEKEFARSSETRFLPIETIPDDFLNNIERISTLVQSQLADYQNIYLMGYSMGGGVAAVAAAKINRESPGTIKGVVLLNSQTEGLQALQELSIPIIFLHGKNDSYFPVDEISRVYRKYQGPKKIVLIDGMDHNCQFNWFRNVNLLYPIRNLLNQLPSVEEPVSEFASSYCFIL